MNIVGGNQVKTIQEKVVQPATRLVKEPAAEKAVR